MNSQKYVLINTLTDEVLSKALLSREEVLKLNYAMSTNGSTNKWILASTLLSRFAEYKV
jgi:hypothetical protein